MKKYFFNILLICVMFTISSCRKTSKKSIAKKTIKELFYKCDDVLPILKVHFSDDVLRVFSSSLDESYVKILANHVKNNKQLSIYLSKNTKAIKTWKFLSNSNYAKNVDVIKYFDELPTSKFTLKTNKGVGEIYDMKSGNLLAKISNKTIVVSKIKNNAFVNLIRLAPKTTYKLKNLNYHIDDLGRVKQIKTPLLKLNNKVINSVDKNGQILGTRFGGMDVGINKTFISDDVFKVLNNDWQNALSNRIKISSVTIKPLYNTNTKIPDAFNISYYKGKDRVFNYIPNTYKTTYSNIFEKLKRSSIGRHIDGRIATKTFPKEISLNGNKLFYKGKEFATINAKTKTIIVDRRAALNKGGINPLLSHPKLLEDYKYAVKDGKNTHIFKTDKFGRVSETEHHIIEKYSKNRNVIEQNTAKLHGDEISSKTSIKNLTNKEHKKLSDEGGHYLADSAGGIPESINITSQAYKVNHSKVWRNMENKIKAAIEKGDDVVVKNKQIYSDNSRRSDGSMFEVIINGKSEKFTFDNINNTLKEIQ